MANERVVMTSMGSGPNGSPQAIRLAALCLVAIFLTGAADAANAAGESFEAYEAALSYRDAVHGKADAQADMGYRYAKGLGVQQSDEKALEWLKRAARHGHAGALLMLSEFYATGRGVPRDDVAAYQWAILAAARSNGPIHENAQATLTTLASRMSEADVAQGRQMADEWRPEGKRQARGRPPSETAEAPIGAAADPAADPDATSSAAPATGDVAKHEPTHRRRVSRIRRATSWGAVGWWDPAGLFGPSRYGQRAERATRARAALSLRPALGVLTCQLLDPE